MKKKEVVTPPVSAKGNVAHGDNDRTQADKKQKSFKESFFEFLDETIDDTDDEQVPIKKPTWQAIKTEKDADTGATGTNQKQQEETYLHVVETKLIRNGYCYLIFAINSPSLHELKLSFVAWRQEHAIWRGESTYAKQGGINLNYKNCFHATDRDGQDIVKMKMNADRMRSYQRKVQVFVYYGVTVHPDEVSWNSIWKDLQMTWRNKIGMAISSRIVSSTLQIRWFIVINTLAHFLEKNKQPQY